MQFCAYRAGIEDSLLDSAGDRLVYLLLSSTRSYRRRRIFSFNSNHQVTVWRGFTTHWFGTHGTHPRLPQWR